MVAVEKVELMYTCNPMAQKGLVRYDPKIFDPSWDDVEEFAIFPYPLDEERERSLQLIAVHRRGQTQRRFDDLRYVTREEAAQLFEFREQQQEE